MPATRCTPRLHGDAAGRARSTRCSALAARERYPRTRGTAAAPRSRNAQRDARTARRDRRDAAAAPTLPAAAAAALARAKAKAAERGDR